MRADPAVTRSRPGGPVALAVALGALLCTEGLAVARAPVPRETIEPAPAETCPALFGDEDARKGNRARRKRILAFIWPGPEVIDLMHRAVWGEPRRLRFDGLRLLETRDEPGGRHVAVVELQRPSADCEPGVYALRRDDAVAGAAVLGVLDDLVLLEHEGELRYLVPRFAESPVWRITWQSPWRAPRVIRPTGPIAPHRPARPPVRRHGRR